ncbi:MAG TPA: hypothetical protein VGK52_01515, partial [Polyangia bacterium]
VDLDQMFRPLLPADFHHGLLGCTGPKNPGRSEPFGARAPQEDSYPNTNGDRPLERDGVIAPPNRRSRKWREIHELLKRGHQLREKRVGGHSS